jgi:hypothetical protein
MAARALLDGRESEAGLIGRIYKEDGENGLVFVAQSPVAITDYGSTRLEPVPALNGATPGQYLLQLLLPNGKVIRRPFEIRRGKDTEVDVSLPHEAPHEWSTLQDLAGQFVAPAAVPTLSLDEWLETNSLDKWFEMKRLDGLFETTRRHVGVLKPFYKHLSAAPASGFELVFLGPDAPPPPLLATNAMTNVAKLVDRDASVEDVQAELGGGKLVAKPAQEEADFALFEFAYEGSLPDGAQTRPHYFGLGEPHARAYLLEKSSAGANLLALPVPWTDRGNEVAVQLFLDKRGIGDGEPRYSVSIADPRINSALGYVQNGALREAAELIDFDAANDLLFHKMSSPLAAAVGGYLLVLGLDRAAYRSKARDWRAWVDNLCNWFPWLPDGAILKAAKYFVLRDQDRNGALEALMTAYDRGLPFFTFGLTLLLEGMRRFANEGEPLARQQLRTLEALAAVTDPTQPFLKLNVARRWQAEAAPDRRVLAHA